MRVSLSITQFPNAPGDTPLDRVVRVADEGGIDTVWVADHLIQYAPGTEPTDPHLEAYTTLGWLAARSERVRLGAMVSPITFRPATLLIKSVSTLDALSGGRAWLGTGTGYHEQEAAQMGIPMPPTAERFERLEDTLRLAHRMFAGDDSPFEGKQVRAERPLNHPVPARRPRILVGGSGERKTLPLVARYADACNLYARPGDEGIALLQHKLDVLRTHCDAEGRSYEAIEKTVLGPAALRVEHPMAMSPDAMPAFFEQLARLGIDHYIVPVIDRNSLDTLLNEVLGRFALAEA